jgi:hypothetical protein
LQPVLGKYGKIPRINHAVFVNVEFIERLMFAAVLFDAPYAVAIYRESSIQYLFLSNF